MQDDFRKTISRLIARCPGCTAQEYARMAIDQGFYGNYSRELLYSLQKILMKEYREGRIPEIKIVKVDGKTRYFPADNLKSSMSAYFRLDARRETDRLKKDNHIF